MSYQNLTDEEIIREIREGDVEATEYLMEKYKNLVRSRAKSMYILGGDAEDLNQEGMIGLYKAIRDYDCGRDASFLTFATLCISRQLYTALQASGRQKNLPLNTAVSLYSAVSNQGAAGGEDEGIQVIHTLPADDRENPESKVIGEESIRLLEQRIKEELSAFEQQVLELRVTGMNYVEIAHVLNRDEKSTDNALQRIRSKIRQMMNHVS